MATASRTWAAMVAVGLACASCGPEAGPSDGGDASSEGGSTGCEPLPDPQTGTVALSENGRDRGFPGPLTCTTTSGGMVLDCSTGIAGQLGWIRVALQFNAPFAAPAAGATLRQNTDFALVGIEYAPTPPRTTLRGAPWTGDLVLTGGAPARLSGRICSPFGWRLAFNLVETTLP